MQRRDFCVGVLLSGSASVWAQGGDVEHITHLLKRQFDRPDAPLKVQPVVVLGDAAVAGWFQQDRGGRALLRKGKAGWSIHVCAGKGLTQADFLVMTGLPKATAAQLASQVMKAESALTAAQRTVLDSFEGVVNVKDAHGGAHGHGHSQTHGHTKP